jgi:high affinity sulfate transporter 1
LAHYPKQWWWSDISAGLVLTAILVPVGMGYSEASGLPAIYGLYATIVPLLVYALFGPSRIMVLGPDSTLAAVIAALIVPLAAGQTERLVPLAGALALLSGACSLIIGLARLGLLADLLSKPIRIGFLNAIALTVLVSQLPKLFGFSSHGDDLPERAQQLVQGLLQGKLNAVATLIGVGSLSLIMLLKQLRPQWPGVLLAVVGATVVTGVLGLATAYHVPVVGGLPQGLPHLVIPSIGWSDLVTLMPGALMIALLSFADTSVLSRSLAKRGGYEVNQNQEMVALGVANMASGLFQGFSISSSASRTPVAEAAGSKSQVTGLVGALAIGTLLMAAPRLLANLPSATLGAVVIAACWSFADIKGMRDLWNLRKSEFVLCLISFLGVAFVGVIEGIFITIALAMGVLIWNTWHPHFAVLVRVDGVKGYHDAQRHPEGRHVPGMVIFRWDAQLFFANAEIFKAEALAAIAKAQTSTKVLVIAADAITGIDISAADVLVDLCEKLEEQDVRLWFAGLKGPVKDLLKHYGVIHGLGPDSFHPTVGRAVNVYRDSYRVNWRDWDETGD